MCSCIRYIKIKSRLMYTSLIIYKVKIVKLLILISPFGRITHFLERLSTSDFHFFPLKIKLLIIIFIFIFFYFHMLLKIFLTCIAPIYLMRYFCELLMAHFFAFTKALMGGICIYDLICMHN